MDPLVQSILVGVISSVGTIAAIKVEMRWLRRDVDGLRKWAQEHARHHARQDGEAVAPLPFTTTEH